MNLVRRSVLIGAALFALPLPAAAQEMCAALNRIAAAAREAVPFASLENSRDSLVPGYHYCRVETGTAARAGEVYCHQQLAPKSLIAETVGAQVRDCLGAVAAPRPQTWSPQEYRTAELAITVESHCDERCHVGRLASLHIRRREADGATPLR
jgi:hypothetical protein